MSAQLELWNGTATDSDSGVVFRIRQSARARRLILQTVPPRTVEIVVPKGIRSGQVHEFVHAHRDWIRRAELELIRAYPVIELRPGIVTLEAVNEQFTVRYLDAGGSQAKFRASGSELAVHCARRDHSDAPGMLRRWLLREARRHLVPWLASEAVRTGLAPQRVQVRLQKTRWGSCSSRGNISLNAALMLVPPELVRYLLVHELSHLKHLSHSKRYWNTVARFEPGYKQLDRRLAARWNRIPAWVTGSDLEQ